MAIYNRDVNDLGGGTLTDEVVLKEHDIYGSLRLGSETKDVSLGGKSYTYSSLTYTNGEIDRPVSPSTISADAIGDPTRLVGDKQYELKNHLGNVMVVVSDKKQGVHTSGSSSDAEYYTADVVSAQDYFAFGATMPGRRFNITGTEFGFGSQREDNEIYGEGNSYTAEHWQYDPRLGRRWNMDPITKPYESPYATFGNNPIYYNDPHGADKEGPNGECPGDANDCEDGSYEVYGEDGKWHDMGQTPTVNGNRNPIPESFMKTNEGRDYTKHSSNQNIDPSKFSWNYKATPGATEFDEDFIGSQYDLFYDNQYIGQFKVRDGKLSSSGGNDDDLSAKLEMTNLTDFFTYYPEIGGGPDVIKEMGDDWVNNGKIGSGGGPEFKPLEKSGKFRVAAINPFGKKNPYNSFLNATGLKSNKFASQLYQQFKSTGKLLYQNGKPVLKVATQFEMKAAMEAGLSPVSAAAFDKMLEEADKK